MKHPFEKVIEGIAQYINTHLYAKMNDWQEFIARVFIGRFFENTDAMKEKLINNGFIRTFGVIDSEGHVDVVQLAKDMKREIARKGQLSFDIPMFGKMTFSPSDVDELFRTITSEELANYENY